MTRAPFISAAAKLSAPVAAFVDKAEALCRRSDPHTFWSLRSDFDSLLCPDIWRGFYADTVRQIASRPSFDGGREWHSSGLAVYDSDEFFLSLRVGNTEGIGLPRPMGARPGLVSTRPAPAMFASLSPEPLHLSIHFLPAQTHLDIFDPSTRLQGSHNVLAKPWSRVDVDAPRELIELHTQPQQAWCLLEFSLKPIVMQRWEFDTSTGAPVGTALTSTASACLMAMLHEITRTRHTEALPGVLRLISHADFNVRWAALRCLGKIHPPAAKEALSSLERDAHPMIASMAKRLLGQLSPPGTQRTD